MVTLEEFLGAELPGLSRFAGALVGDPHTAEDVLADALVAVVSRWGKIAAADNPLAYVRRIVVNTHLSHQRKAARRRTRVEERDAPGPAGGDVGEAVAHRDETDRLLRRLPPQQRAAVVLRYLLDQDDQQIAEVLGCSTATVRSHLSHARTTLRLAEHADSKGN